MDCSFGGGDARHRGHERIDDRHGRYVHGQVRSEGEPDRCFEGLEAIGVLRDHEGLVFELGPDADFVSREDGSVSVRYPCATGRLGDVGEPTTDGDRTTVVVEVVRASEDEALARLHGEHRCPGTATAMMSVTCVATLERTGSIWTFRGFDDPDSCPRRGR
ncbi:MAG: hypothetical protein M3Y87_07010 [Myxococcota bacterium]|nr:hypothetical protein [Myxococcota bacterium]